MCFSAIGYVHHVHDRQHLEKFAGHMRSGPITAGAEVDLARMGHGVSNELRNRLCRKGRIYRHDKGHAHDACDWSDVADEIEIEMLIERCVDRVRRSGYEKHVAVGGSVNNGFGRYIARSARPVLNNELPIETLR